MSEVKVPTKYEQITTLQANLESERRAWNERGREIDRLRVSLEAAETLAAERLELAERWQVAAGGERLRAENAIESAEHFEHALREISNDGRCVSAIAPSPCRGSHKTRKDWCWCCIAIEALARASTPKGTP